MRDSRRFVLPAALLLLVAGLGFLTRRRAPAATDGEAASRDSVEADPRSGAQVERRRATRSRAPSKRPLVSRAVLVAALALAVGVVASAGTAPAASTPADVACAPTSGETLSTNGTDFAPGDVVHIRGSGFAATCDISVLVTGPQGAGAGLEATSKKGSFSYSYTAPAATGAYTADAVGAGGAVLASASFTVTGPATPPPPPSTSPVPQSPCARTGLESITAGSSTYAAGATAHISGTGFAYLCSVTVRVTDPSSALSDAVVVTDITGGLSADHVVGSGSGTYTVETRGLGDVTLATTTLTVTGSGPTTSACGGLCPPPPAHLSLSLSPSSIVANGTATSVATATVTDANDHAVGGATVDFSKGASDDVTFASGSSAVTNSSGQASVTITASTTAGSNTITATVHDTAISDSETLAETAGSLDHITITPAEATIAAGSTQAYSAEAFDQYGNSRGTVTGSTSFGISGSGSCAGNACGADTAGDYTVSGSYSGKSDDALLHVTALDQTITFGPLTDKTYGDADFTVSATASSGLQVSFSASGSCTVSGSTVHLTGAGSCTITASQAGNGSYNAAPDVPRTFSIGKAALTITAADKTKTYGAANPVFTVGFSGFVGSDGPGSLSGSMTCNAYTTGAYTTPVTAATPTGTYPIHCTAGTLTSANYAFTFVDGTLTVTKATLTVTAADKTKVEGDPDPAFTFTYAGFQNGDTGAAIDTPPTCGVTGSHSSAGTYPITCSGGVDDNYAFSYVSGTLTVQVAPASPSRPKLTVSPNDQTMVSGGPDPAFTFTYSGFVNGDGAGVIDTPPKCGVAVAHATAGTYTITCSGGADDKYDFAYQTATLTVTPVPSGDVNAYPVEGFPAPKVKYPGSDEWVVLSDPYLLPLGTQVDLSGGAAIEFTDQTGQTMIFYGEDDGVTSQFTIGQLTAARRAVSVRGAVGPPVVDVQLGGGDFTRCTNARFLSSAAAQKPVRRLWGKGKGNYRTRGRYASGTVRGTWWLTEDFCNGTRVTVKEGAVEVYDSVKKKTVLVTAGSSYFAQKRNASHKVAQFGMKPSRPVAGAPFSVFLIAVDRDSGAVIKNGSVRCVASVSGKALPASVRRMAAGRAVCTFRIPVNAKGKRILGSITLRAGGLEASRRFTSRIR